MRRLRSLFRLSLPALAAFAWRNRDELFEFAGFGLRAIHAALPGGAGFDDVKTEARVRYALSMDKRTRRADGLHVEVLDGGQVLLAGVVRQEVFDVAPEIVQPIEGVTAIDNQLRVPNRSRFRRSRAEITPAS